MTKVYGSDREKARRLGVPIEQLHWYLDDMQLNTAMSEEEMREIERERFIGKRQKANKGRTLDDMRRDAMRQALAETKKVFQTIDAEVREVRQTLFGTPESPYPPPLKMPDGAHEQVREVAGIIAGKIGGDPLPFPGRAFGVESYILQGILPVLAACEVGWVITGADTDSTRARVEFRIIVRYPWVPKWLVAGEYQDAVNSYRRMQGKTAKRKQPAPKRAHLQAFLAENPEGSYRDLMAKWNQAYPDWRYSTEGAFRTACSRARKADITS